MGKADIRRGERMKRQALEEIRNGNTYQGQIDLQRAEQLLNMGKN